MGYLFSLPLIVFGTNRVLKKIFRGGLAAIIVLILIVSVQSSIVYNRDFKENSIYLQMRLAQQGQLWWATYGLEKNQSYKTNELKDEYKNFFKMNISEENLHNSGIYKIMKLTTSYNVYKHKVEDQNSRYAYSTQATIYYYFRGIGVLMFSIISGIFYFITTNNLIKSVTSLKVIPTILYTRLIVILNTTLLQSDFQNLFSLETLIIIYLLIINKYIHRLFVEITPIKLHRSLHEK